MCRWDRSTSHLRRPLISAPTAGQWCQTAAVAAAEAAVQLDRLADLTDEGAGEAFSQQEQPQVRESSTEKAAGDSLALPIRGVGRPEGFQVEAAEIQVTEETVQVEEEEVQVIDEELAVGTQAGGTRRDGEEDKGMEYESDSDYASISDSQSLSGSGRLTCSRSSLSLSSSVNRMSVEHYGLSIENDGTGAGPPVSYSIGQAGGRAG